jgi:uncharacterized phiE125 gp8 family phage protein
MLKLATAPTEPAVSLAELKAHLRIEGDAEDGDLALKLAGATEYVAGYLRRCLVTTTYDLRLACWPDRAYLDIPLGNLQSVTHIKYTDSAGVEHTVDPATYKLAHVYTPADPLAVPPVVGDGALDAGIGRLYLAYGASWPSATLDTGEPIVIRFTAGGTRTACLSPSCSAFSCSRKRITRTAMRSLRATALSRSRKSRCAASA